MPIEAPLSHHYEKGFSDFRFPVECPFSPVECPFFPVECPFSPVECPFQAELTSSLFTGKYHR